MSKAKIIKLDRPYMIVMDDKIVAFGKSGYQASEIANQLGATKIELEKWTLGQPLVYSTSLSSPSFSGGRQKTKT